MVFRTLVLNSAAKRIPMIKFRKGAFIIDATNGPEEMYTETTASTSESSSTVESSGPTIEDWELPPRYWRKPIDDYEMEYINNGGPFLY